VYDGVGDVVRGVPKADPGADSVPAPSAEPPSAAEQRPETEPQTGWQWLNTSDVGLIAGAFIDSISSWLAPPPPTASRSSSRMPPPPGGRQMQMQLLWIA
jgi:hypothetical protein